MIFFFKTRRELDWANFYGDSECEKTPRTIGPVNKRLLYKSILKILGLVHSVQTFFQGIIFQFGYPKITSKLLLNIGKLILLNVFAENKAQNADDSDSRASFTTIAAGTFLHS